MSDGAPLIEVSDLEKHFPLSEEGKTVQAAHNVSFTIQPGETLGLIGESGSGKTTVGRCLLRLIEPTSGEIRFRGERIDQLDYSDFRPYRAKMQIVFQEPTEALNRRMSVRKLLREPLRLHEWGDEAAVDRRINELLDMVALPSAVIDRRPPELSGGAKQRVAIARALATNPEFVVLDEPTSALPPDSEEVILGLLRELQDELDLSYLFISHDLSLVRHFCDRVAVMYLSQIVELGTFEEVFGNPQMPYSRALLSAVLLSDPGNKRADRDLRHELEGEIPSPVDLPDGCYLASRCPIAKQPRCAEEPQVLTPVAGEHLVRCWRTTEGDYSYTKRPEVHGLI